jgi:hypothetical protein
LNAIKLNVTMLYVLMLNAIMLKCHYAEMPLC